MITLPSTGCQDFMTEDLSQNRLIGFQAVVSDYTGGRRNIRSLGVIVDSGPYCGVVPFGGETCESPATGMNFEDAEDMWSYFGYPYCVEGEVPQPVEE